MNKTNDLKTALIENGILDCYKVDSHICINNFLQGNIGKENYFYYDSYQDAGEEDLFYEKFYLKKSGFFAENIPYNPVTSKIVEGVMLMDALFRASQKQKHNPIKVYRGIKSIEDDVIFNTVLSTSLDKYVAFKHAITKILEIELTQDFPIIVMDELVNRTITTLDYCVAYNDEKEILLPPCEGKIISQDRMQLENGFNGEKNFIDNIKVQLTPKSLAQTFLERMNNLPKDYPKRFVIDKDYEFAKSKRRLEKYIKNFVKTGTIPEVSDIVKSQGTFTK